MADDATPASQSGTFEYSEEDYDRIILKESIFDEVGTSDLRESEALSQKLYNLQEREIKQHMHAVTLSDYLRKKIIPRGLRLQKSPALGQESPAFCQRWCEILNKCSFDLMALVISEITQQMETTRAECKQTEARLKAVTEKKKFTEIKKELERHRADCAEELRNLKKSKFARDLDDYKQNKVYFWKDGKPESPAKPSHARGQRLQPARHRPKQYTNRSWMTSSSFESGSDMSDQSGRGAPFLGYAHRRPPRPPQWGRRVRSDVEGDNARERKQSRFRNNWTKPR